MARIKTYEQDNSLNKLDKLLGTDSNTDATKNFTISSLIQLINELTAINFFDGLSYEFQDYDGDATDPEGILNITGTSTIDTSFNAITQLIISKKGNGSPDVENYIRSLNGSSIKISEQTDIDNFGIFKIIAVNDYTNDRYLQLTLTSSNNNGNLTAGTKYFFSSFQASIDTDLSDRTVTEFGDVIDAGSGEIITTPERNKVINAVLHSEVVNNLTSTSIDDPLSAAQGKVLKDLIDAINTLLEVDTEDAPALDTLREIVNFCQTNASTLSSLTISSISGLQTALNSKQNSESGKGLSTNDLTNELLSKLNGIATGAQVNVQTDWEGSGDAAILNKPNNLIDTSSSVTSLNDVSSAGSGYIITDSERIKLTNIDVNSTTRLVTDGTDSITVPPQNAEQNVKANWDESDSASDAFIQNKPSIVEPTRTITIQGTQDQVTVSPDTAQDLSADRTITVSLPDDVTIGDDLTVTNKINLGGPLEFTGIETTTPAFDNGIYYSTEDGHDTLHFRYHGNDLSIDYLTENIPTGILNGGELSTNTSTTFDIAAGDGIINILNKGTGTDPHPEIKRIEWSATTVSHTLGDANDADQINTWVYVDQNGAIQQTTSDLTPGIWRSNIVLGAVIHSSNVIRFVRTFPRTAYSSGNTYAEFVEIFGPLKKSGHLLTVNSTNTLALDRAAGQAFALGRNYVTDPLNPSLVSDGASTPAFHRYSSTSTGFTKDNGPGGIGFDKIDPSKYDNNGTLTNMSAGQYSVQRLYHFPNNTNVIIAYYGKAEYASIDEAEKNYLLENFQEANNTSTQAIYLGALVVKGNATDLSNAAQAKILTGGIFRSLTAANLGGVAANSALSDLSDVTITSPTNGQVVKYNSTTGQFENQADAGGIQLTDLSVGTEGTASGDGDVSYNNTTGVFTYTPPDLSSYLTSAIDGTGTAGTLPKMSDSDTITDSSISESGEVITVDSTGAIKVPSGTTPERNAITSPVNGMFRYNSTDAQFEGYADGAWGAIAGSGGGSSTFNVDKISGNGSSSFTLAQSVANENNTQVYIDGVYQSKDNYSINGTSINFTTAPPTGTDNIEVVSVTSVALEQTSTLTKDSFTGNGLQFAYNLSVTPTSKDLTFVYIQGVYQEKSTYSLSGSTITFTTAPQNGYTFEVMSLTAANITQTSYMASDEFSNPIQGQTSFTLVNGTPSNKSFTMVFISGVFQDKSTYSLTSGSIVLSEGVDAEDTVEIISIGNGGVIGKAVSDANDARYSVNVISNSATAVSGAVYVFTASLTLTLPASPEIGESIKISNRSGVATCVLGRNGNKILGAAADLTLDTASASFELIYSGTAQGWIIIGQ